MTRQVQKHLSRALVFAAAIIFAAFTLSAQSRHQATDSPKDVVTELWQRATEGLLLNPEGWNKSSGLFVHPTEPPKNRSFQVVSNEWRVGPVIDRGDMTEVDVEYGATGEIDSSLRYTPPPKIPYMKTRFAYYLVWLPSYLPVYGGADGRTVVGKQPTGTGIGIWQINDPRMPPWTTVNTAIRYVLEKREKTADPVIRKNADETLKILLRWN
jgi:hypothetical protein